MFNILQRLSTWFDSFGDDNYFEIDERNGLTSF